MEGERFELELLGGSIERRYRKARPEVEAMPWGTLDSSGTPADELIAARLAWTSAAYQEHRTAAACALTLRALIEARAPLDLIALAARFPLDELVHVELCARMAMELGGGTEIIHKPERMVKDPDAHVSPLLKAAECVVRYFCVGEAVSIPLLRATWKSASHPLPRAVLGRIVKDEAAHGVFGYVFLDWALPQTSAEDRQFLGAAADRAIRAIYDLWSSLEVGSRRPGHGDMLGWLGTSEYLDLARRCMQSEVISRLESRGIPILAQLPAHTTSGPAT